MIRHFQHHFLSYSGFSLSTRLAPYIWRKPDGAMGSSALIAMNREILALRMDHVRPSYAFVALGRIASSMNGTPRSQSGQPRDKLVSVPVQEALDIAGDIAARPRPSFTRGIGSTLDVVGMGDNRIGTDDSFVCGITKNQTATLTRKFKESVSGDGSQAELVSLIDRVNLMTPENIHLNSFMYEPILDMSAEHLAQLHNELVAILAG